MTGELVITDSDLSAPLLRARSSRRFNSAANASCAAREPRIQPMTTPTSSTAGMKMKCADVMCEKFTVVRLRPLFA